MLPSIHSPSIRIERGSGVISRRSVGWPSKLFGLIEVDCRSRRVPAPLRFATRTNLIRTDKWQQ